VFHDLWTLLQEVLS